MKNKILSLIIGLTTVNALFATDHTVQEGGTTGTFSSISSAISAAVNGDRIIIHPKIGGNAWVEPITIDKSLELISSQDGTKYKIQGDITIVGQNGRNVTIIGAHLVSGNITGSTTSAWKTTVNILGCQLDGGRIDFNSSYYSTIVSNVLLIGEVRIGFGNVIGNQLTDSQIQLYNMGSSTDTINVIANKCKNIYSTSPGIVNIINNYIYNNVSINGFKSIHFASNPTSGRVQNNTVCTPPSTGSSSSYYNYFLLGGGTNLLIQNNIFTKSISGNYSPYMGGAGASNHNYYYSVSYGIPSGPTEITLTSNPVDGTGSLILPTVAQNGANPAFEFYDLDLTVGDAGCYGGSYTLDNYFPITGSSRVFNIDMPFGMFSGGTLNIKATGFDK